MSGVGTGHAVARARLGRRPGRFAALLVALLAAAPGLRAQGDSSAEGPSPWYLERLDRGAVATSELPPEVPSVVPDLEALLRDGSVPGFYDGQFAVTADRFDELVAVAHDDDLHHVIRIMAVMALQEAAEGERLREALEPLLVPAELEVLIDRRVALRFFTGDTLTGDAAEAQQREELDADLSRHARFALAKGGQPEAVRKRIDLMVREAKFRERFVLDPDADPWDFRTYFGRSQWFSIAYHYQQFDDYENAALWFRALTENLRGGDARWAHYNLACIAALQGRPQEALVELRGAIEDGFSDLAWMDEDGDLASLRGRAEFQALRVELGAEPISNTAEVENPPGS